MTNLEKNIETIQKRIASACERSGRKQEEITLIGVSKTVDADYINASYDHGIRILGENKVQEIVDKKPHLKPEFSLHLIGHLQRNKVKYIIDKVAMIHSVDSIRLAKEIDKRAGQHELVMDVLIQVNVSGEASKFGCEPAEVATLLEEISHLPHLRVKGFMTMAPYSEDPEEARIHFRRCKEIFDMYQNKTYDNIEISELSMGMTGDFEVAIEEGATMIRVGSGIYGARNYEA